MLVDNFFKKIKETILSASNKKDATNILDAEYYRSNDKKVLVSIKGKLYLGDLKNLYFYEDDEGRVHSDLSRYDNSDNSLIYLTDNVRLIERLKCDIGNSLEDYMLQNVYVHYFPPVNNFDFCYTEAIKATDFKELYDLHKKYFPEHQNLLPTFRGQKIDENMIERAFIFEANMKELLKRAEEYEHNNQYCTFLEYIDASINKVLRDRFKVNFENPKDRDLFYQTIKDEGIKFANDKEKSKISRLVFLGHGRIKDNDKYEITTKKVEHQKKQAKDYSYNKRSSYIESKEFYMSEARNQLKTIGKIDNEKIAVKMLKAGYSDYVIKRTMYKCSLKQDFEKVCSIVNKAMKDSKVKKSIKKINEGR